MAEDLPLHRIDTLGERGEKGCLLEVSRSGIKGAFQPLIKAITWHLIDNTGYKRTLGKKDLVASKTIEA
jgi:hypothetical protein